MRSIILGFVAWLAAFMTAEGMLNVPNASDDVAAKPPADAPPRS